jgi:hypothetical protein
MKDIDAPKVKIPPPNVKVSLDDVEPNNSGRNREVVYYIQSMLTFMGWWGRTK